MYHIKNDQRAIRSGQALYDALAQLIRAKPFTAITVSELVEAAQVGRATFYRNFDTIEDILRMRCDQVLSELLAYIIAYRAQTKESGTALLKPLLRYFYRHSEIIELLLLAKRIDIIQDAFRAGVAPFRPQLAAHQGVAEEYVTYSIAVRIGAVTSVLIHWIENGKQHAPDQLADALQDMIGQMVTLDQFM